MHKHTPSITLIHHTPSQEGNINTTHYVNPNPNKTNLRPPAPNFRNRHPTSEIESGWAILSHALCAIFPKRDVFNAVLIAVAKAFADMNNKSITAEKRSYMVNELTDNIIARYPCHPHQRNPVAIGNGIRGKYGEVYGLSVVNFERFIEQYLLSDERVRAVKQVVRDEHGRLIPSLDEQFALAKENTLMAFGRKQTGKSFGNMAGSVYDFLDKFQLFHFTGDEKYDLMADACPELVGDLKYQLLTSPGHQRIPIKNDITVYTAALTGALTIEQKQNLVRISKRLARDAYFNQLLMEELDLGKMIDGMKALF